MSCRYQPPLNDEHPAAVVANDRVLLFLNGSNDVLHPVIRTVAKHLLKQFIADCNAGVEHHFDCSIVDDKLPFQAHFSAHRACGSFK